MPTTQMLRKGNSELAEIGVWTWSIPALKAESEVAGKMMTCPHAGVCASLCYARSGRYRFGNVLKAHTRNLDRYLINRELWVKDMMTELQHKRFRPTGIPHEVSWAVRDDFSWWQWSGARSLRIHDAGDFFDDQYLRDWLRVAAATPDVVFYAYTKSVQMFKDAEAEGLVPPNFVIIFSMGGKQDALVDKDVDRHDDIFPSDEAMEAAGYADQEESDLMAALLPNIKIGIVANAIPQFKKKQGDQSFSDLQKTGFKKPKDEPKKKRKPRAKKTAHPAGKET